MRNSDGSFVDFNSLIYVILIHECAHCACDEIGHSDKFWRVMEFMKQQAIKYGIYKKTSYS